MLDNNSETGHAGSDRKIDFFGKAQAMTTRSVLGLLYILRGMEAIGECSETALTQFGLSLAQLDPTAQIDRQLELNIRIALATDLSQAHMGLKVGQYFSLAGYGPLVMLLMTCPTIGDALRLGVAFQALTFLYGRLRIEQDADQVALVLTPLQLSEPAHRFLIDGEMAGTFKLLRDLQSTFGGSAGWVRVNLPIAQPTDADMLTEYQQYYGRDVSFGHTEGRFIAPLALLDQSLMTADSAGNALYYRQCEIALQARQSHTTGWPDRVRDYLGLHGDQLPDIATTARALGLAERSLRYQLAQASTSFRQLRDHLRHQQAIRLLMHPQLSIERIAEQLGYAEAASFIHAFGRWQGCSPHQYRLRQQDSTAKK